MIRYWLYLCGQFLALLLPRGVAYFFACSLASFHIIFSPRDWRGVQENLKCIMPDVSVWRKKRIAVQLFFNFSKYLVDFFCFSRVNQRFIAERVKIENENFLKESYNLGKGVLVLTAHIGNWELGGAVLGLLGYPFYAVALPHADPRVNHFFDAQRKRCGVGVIPLGIALKKCFQVLKEGKMVAFLGDRDFSGSGEVFPFFGKPAIFPLGPARFSLRTGASIVPGFMIRRPSGKFSLIFEKPIFPKTENGQDKTERDLASEYIRIIEQYISRYPDQWYLFQPFWKEI